MDERKLKLLIENELYSLVLAYSQDELAKINYNTVRKAINQFIGKYKKELTIKNIDFLTEYLWTVINKKNRTIEKER